MNTTPTATTDTDTTKNYRTVLHSDSSGALSFLMAAKMYGDARRRNQINLSLREEAKRVAKLLLEHDDVTSLDAVPQDSLDIVEKAKSASWKAILRIDKNDIPVRRETQELLCKWSSADMTGVKLNPYAAPAILAICEVIEREANKAQKDANKLKPMVMNKKR